MSVCGTQCRIRNDVCARCIYFTTFYLYLAVLSVSGNDECNTICANFDDIERECSITISLGHFDFNICCQLQPVQVTGCRVTHPMPFTFRQ